MANRYPLIANSSANQIQELASSDNIDLTNNYIVGVVGVNASGIITATSFVGDITGDVTGNASGLTGTPDITVRNITGVAATFSGVVTYEDVTNVDSIGIVTARGGFEIGAAGVGGTITSVGNAEFVGIVTASAGADLNGFKTEEGVYDTTALNGEFDFEFENGHVQTHTGSTAGTYFPDFRVSSSTSLNSVMGVGDVVSCTLIVAASNTAHYCTTGIKIDNSTSNVTIEWIGSSAASAGKGAGYDIYAFTIQKTAATPAYLVIVNATDAG